MALKGLKGSTVGPCHDRGSAVCPKRFLYDRGRELLKTPNRRHQISLILLKGYDRAGHFRGASFAVAVAHARDPPRSDAVLSLLAA